MDQGSDVAVVVWRPVGRLGKRPAGVGYQIDGSLVVLAGGLSQFVKVRQREISKPPHVGRGPVFRPVQPRHEPLKVSLGRCHLRLAPTHSQEETLGDTKNDSSH